MFTMTCFLANDSCLHVRFDSKALAAVQILSLTACKQYCFSGMREGFMSIIIPPGQKNKAPGQRF